MNNTFAVLCFLVVAVFSLPTYAQSVNSPVVYVSSTVLSKYVDENGVILHDRGVLQTNIYAMHDSGIYYGLWWSMGLENTNLNSDTGDEIDYFAGWYGLLGPIQVDAGVTYLDLYALGGDSKGDTWAPYLELSHVFQAEHQKVEPFIRVDGYVADEEMLGGGGYRTRVGFRHELQVNQYVSTKSRVSLLHDDGTFGSAPTHVTEIGAAVEWKVGWFTFQLPTLLYMKPSSHADDRGSELIFGSGFSFEF